jgi:NAD(P) transhydrogenase subunit alpha
VINPSVTIIGALNLAGALAGNASSLYARNLQNFLDLIVTKEGALAIDWEDEIINGTALVKQGSAVHPLLNA